MTSEQETKEMFCSIVAAMKRPPEDGVYSNYRLVGKEMEPYKLNALALHFPAAVDSPRYLLLSIVDEQEPNRDLYRRRLLNLRVPQEYIELQREQVDGINERSSLQDFMVDLVNAPYHQAGLPLTVVMFGTTITGEKELVYIFHSGMLPTVFCLEMLQGAVRDAEEQNP